MPSVLWRCWLGSRKGIWPVKNWVVWLSVWSKVQTCIWPSWCHCHSPSLASVKSRLVLPFWYRLTWVVPERGPLNGCVCVCALLWQFDFGDAEWLAQTSTVKNSVIWLHCWPLDQSVSSELTHRWVDLSCWQVDLSMTWPAAPRSFKILSMSLNYLAKSAWWKHIVLSWTECSEPQDSVAKNSCQLYLCSDGVISWSTGNTHLQWLYKNKGKTKKKDVMAKHLCTWMAFSHSVRLN